jgi:hypothetical protein
MNGIEVKEWLLTSPNKPGLCKGEIKAKEGGKDFTIEHTPGPDAE